MERPSPTTSNINTIVRGQPTLEGLPLQIKDIIYSKAAQSGKDYASIRRLNRQISKREDIVNIKCTNPPLFLLLDFLLNSRYYNIFSFLVNGKKLVSKKKPASNRKGELATGKEETTFELYITIDKISNRKISISIALYRNYFSLYLNKNTIGGIYDQIFSFIDDKEGRIFEDISIYPPPLVWFKLVKDRAGCNQVKVLKYIREFTLLVYKKELKKALDEYKKERIEENEPIEFTMTVDEYVEHELDLIRKLKVVPSDREIALPVTIKKWIGVEYKLPISYVLWVIEDIQHTSELLDFLGDKISRNTQFSFVAFEFTRNEYKAPEGLIKDEFYKFYEEKGIEEEKYIDTQWEIYLERAKKISQSQIRKEDRGMNYPDKNNMTDEELERFYDSIGLTNRTYRDYKKQRYIKNRDNKKKRTEKQVNIDNFVLSMPEGLTRKTASKYVTQNATGYTNNDKIKIVNAYLDKTAASRAKSSKEESEESEEEKSEELPPKRSPRKSPNLVRRTKKLSPTIEKEETEPIEMGEEEEQSSEEEIEEDLSRVTEMEKRRARRS